jgi:hypothetical protein
MSVSFYLSQSEKENVVIQSLFEGCPEAKTLTTLDDYQPSEVAVVMGVFKKAVPVSFPRGHVIAEQKRRGLKVLVLESGYIFRGDGENNYYALGWGGINGRADFRNQNSPEDRALKLGVKPRPWKTGSKILLCGQVPWDASVDFTDHIAWLNETANVLKMLSQRKVVFRPHPLAKLNPIPGCEYSFGRPIGDDLEDCHAVVTFNSNSGVNAVLEGIPVFAFDMGSMVYSIANKTLSQIVNPLLQDRTQWLNDIAYAQWTPEEMRSGEAWEHISRPKPISQ